MDLGCSLQLTGRTAPKVNRLWNSIGLIISSAIMEAFIFTHVSLAALDHSSNCCTYLLGAQMVLGTGKVIISMILR